MEKAYWIDWRQGRISVPPGGRAYFGHETCQKLLPSPRESGELAKLAGDIGVNLTLVVPFLTNDGLDRACRLVDGLFDILGQFEVVCSDWGLLYYLAEQGVGTPVIGRLLSAQASDPRIARILCPKAESPRPRLVRHLDGTSCLLVRTPPSRSLANHYRGCWLDKPSVSALLSRMGVTRCEISNTRQGVELTDRPGWSYSLHVPDVLVTVMRHCPGEGEDFTRAACNCSDSCNPRGVEWIASGIDVPLFRRDNAVFYRWPSLPPNLDTLPIDRIVYRDT